MSPRDEEDPRSPLDDPFRAEDPAAAERERRRLQREAKRRGRDNRQSLASRVSGALDGAASKGREAIEQTREWAKSPEPPGDGVEPPPFRRRPSVPKPPPAREKLPEEKPPPAPPEPAPAEVPSVAARRAEPSDEGRLSAEALMPRRESRRPFETEDSEAVPPEPIVATPVPQRSESEEWAAPPPVDPPPSQVHEGSAPRRRPGIGGAAGGGAWMLWRQRLLALVVIVAIGAGGAYALSRMGGEDPAPAPAGPKKLKTSSITIPEGFTAEETAGVAKDAGLSGNYEKATRDAAKKVDLAKDGAPKDASLEGFLFPATYDIEKGAPASDLVDKQLEAFDANLAEVDLGFARKKNLSIYDVVTIASMIEREVQVPKERELVAAVIYNRLADAEPLGIDATLRYEVGFDEPLTESQLAAESPYNSRLNPGLPPTPIGNPGLASLQAAADPANVDFKYYVFKPGSCGEHKFTADYDEFLNAQADYQAALEAEGGQPADC